MSELKKVKHGMIKLINNGKLQSVIKIKKHYFFNFIIFVKIYLFKKLP